MAAVRLCRDQPDFVADFKVTVQPMLNSAVHGLILVGINMMIEMIRHDVKMQRIWQQFAIPFTKILQNLVSRHPTAEFSAAGLLNDPFLQVKVMEALSRIRPGKAQAELEETLETIITTGSGEVAARRMVQLAAVSLASKIATREGLRGVAVNAIGRLLQSSDASVLYSALCCLSRVLGSSSAEKLAVSRYESSIAALLGHFDPSIRRRALDVISRTIDGENCEYLVPELLRHLRLSDSDFRAEMVGRLYGSIVKYAPSREWLVDSVVRILRDSGTGCLDIIPSFCEWAERNVGWQEQVADRLSQFLTPGAPQPLVQVAAYMIGEASRRQELEILASFLQDPQTQGETKGYLITAIAKLAVRIGQIDQALHVLEVAKADPLLEVAQRAGELTVLLRDEKALQYLAPNGPVAEQTDQPPEAVASGPAQSSPSPPAAGPAERDKGTRSGTGSAPQSEQAIVHDRSQQSRESPTELTPSASFGQSAVEVGRASDLVVFGKADRNPSNPRQIRLALAFRSGAALPISNFSVDYRVMPGWTIQTAPPSGTGMVNGSSIAQWLMLQDCTGATFSLTASCRFLLGAQPITETVSIALPPC